MNPQRLVDRTLVIIWLAIWPASCASAQQTVRFDHLTVKDGLSQGTVLCILQDRQGFMWFGTLDGLNRYDGYRFTVFRHSPGDPKSINDNLIVMIAEDTAGTIWVETNDHPDTLNRFDPRMEMFGQIPKERVDLHGASISSSRSRYEDRSGVWWEGVKNGGLRRTNRRTGETKVYQHNPADTASLIDNDVFQIAEDPSGILWVSTSGGLERFDPKTGAFVHFRHDPKNPNSLSDNETWPLLVDRQGTLWVGSFQGGLNRFDRTSETFVHYRHDESNPRSIGGDRLYALYQDRAGMIWVGTGDHGIDRFHPEMAAFVHYAQEPGKPSTLSDNNIQSIFVDTKGIAWIGTTHGVNRLDRKTGTFTTFTHDPNNPRSIGDDVAPSLLVDRTGVLWIGTTSSGLDRMDPVTGSFTHYRHNPSDPSSLSEDEVYSLLEDHRGDLWIGTYAGGLNRFNSKTHSFKTYRSDPAVNTSLGSESVWSLLEDREGVLWVGTNGGGLNRFNQDTETFTRYTHNETDPKSISDDRVLCLYEDRGGQLWIGTLGGLNLFDRQSGTFEHYREKDGLVNDNVFGILEDIQGNLWMSTIKGISKFDPQAKKFHTYDYTDGLQGNEFNQGAYARDPKTGEMFFGGPNGLNVFKPENVKTNPYLPPVVLSSFTRYNTDDQEGRPIAEKGISVRSEIAVSYKDNITSFEFAALSYYNNFKNQYAYQLKGFNENWIQLGTDRRATFTNLDGGDYVLHVKGSNNDGVWNEEGTSIRFTVNPPWWKTRWAYGSYVILVLGFLYGARRADVNRREQKARVRESELRAKAAEAEKRALEAENERKTKELEDARRLQLSMLPKDVPQLSEYEIAVFMKTSTEVGGDYYDFSIAPNGELNVAFGDATGHGMQAGTIVTLMKGLFVSEVSKFEIQGFFNHCSTVIKDIKLGRLFMALTIARFRGKSVSLSSAGMPPAYLYRKADQSVEEILLKAVPLGSMKNFPYPLHRTDMESGDTLLFLTDGLPEQKNAGEEMFDYARVVDCFKNVAQQPPNEVINQLVRDGEMWMDGVAQADDITLLVIRKT